VLSHGTGMTESERAVALFESGYSCSQAICQAYGEALGLSQDGAARVAAGFGAGLARSDQVCGAVSGGVMVLGLAYGGTEPGDAAAREATYAAVRQFLAEFTAAHGSVRCTDLLGYNLGSPEEFAAAREAGIVRERCPGLVRSAGRLLDQVIEGRR